MAMSVQRQADQFDLEGREDLLPRVSRHEIEGMLKPGRRIQGGLLNTRGAGAHSAEPGIYDPMQDEGYHAVPEIAPKRRNLDYEETGDYRDLSESAMSPQRGMQKEPGEPGEPRHDGTQSWDWGPEGDGLPQGFDREYGGPESTEPLPWEHGPEERH
jgi:hypothetical protein